MLHKDPWPNRLGFDICEGDRVLAEVQDDPILPYAQIRLLDRSNYRTKYLRFHREFSLLGTAVRLAIPSIDAILALAEDLGEEIE